MDMLYTCGPCTQAPWTGQVPQVPEPIKTAYLAWKPPFIRSQGKSHNAKVWPWSCALSSLFSSSLNAGKQFACNRQTQNPAARSGSQAQELRLRKERDGFASWHLRKQRESWV